MKARFLRWLRVGSRLLIPVALVLTFLLAFLVGVLLHLPLPPSRRVATRLVMEQVSHAIRGSIEIETISRLHLQGIEAKGVTIRDPDGEPILHAPVLRARASLIGIGMSLLPWSDGIRVPVSWVHVEHIDVVFREDLVGELTLGTTFLPPPEPVVTPAKPSKPSLPVVVDLRGIEINSVQAKGQLGGLSPVDWRARSLRGTVYVGPDGVRIDTTSFPLAFHRILQEPIQTTVDYHFRSPELMWTSVLARYRDITLSGRVQLKGEDMMIDVDLPRTDGRSFDPFLPEAVRLEDEVEGKIVAHGPIPVLQTHVRLASDKTTVDGIGTVTLAPQFRTDIDVDIRRLDLSRIVVDGPKSNLDADLMVRARVDSKGRGRVRLTGDVSPTVLFDVPLPGADVEALIDSDGVSGVAHIHEFGMPVRADFTVSETGKVRVTAVTNVPSLIVVPRLQRAIGGYAVAKLEGTWDQGQLDAKVSTQGGNLVRDGVRLGAANVELHLWGPPEGLRMDARVRGTRLDLGGAKWNGVEASLQGPVKTPQLRMRLSDDAFPDVNVVAGLDVRDRLAARDVDVTIDQGQERVAVRTDMLELRDGVVDLGALAIDGLGEPIDAMARIASTGFDVRVVSDGIDLDRLSRIVPLPGPRVTGIVGIDVDLRNVGDETSGCARFDMQDGKVHTLFPISAIDLSVRALFTGRHVELDTNVSMGGQGKAAPPPSDRVGLCLPARPVREGGIAKARATASLTLGGPPAQVSSWEGLMGTARLVDATVDLNRVQTMITPMTALQSVVAGGDSLGLGGTIRLNGDFVRDRPDAPPTWMLAASTTNLDIQLPTTGMVNRVKGADLFATVAMDRGGLLRGSMCVSSQSGPYVADTCNPARAEVLANLSLMAELDYQQLFETPKLWKQVLVEAKVDSRLVVHDRPASALLRPLQLEGALPVDADRASATVAWRGTVLAPHVDYRLQLVGIGTRDLAWRTPTSICGQGQYDGRQAWLHADLRRSREGLGTDAICSLSPGGAVSSLGTVDADLTVGWKDVISWWSEPMISWEANVKAMIHSFELSDIPAFGDNGVSGRARLAGTVKGLGKKPEVDVQLGLEDLRTGPTVDYDQSHIRVRADASGLQGSLAFIDVDEKGETTSSLTLAVDTEQVRWEGGWYPAKDGSKPVKIALESKRFKLGMLTPLVQPVFSYVEGELTGKAEGTWSPAEGKSRIDEMYFFVDNGAFQVPAIGQEFLQVKGALQAANSERIFVEPFRAQSLTGSLEGRATIDLRDLDIEHVEASIWTPDRDKIRLTFAGIPVGDLAGNVNVSIDPGKEQHDVKVVFDGVRVDLPRTDMRSVQQLDDNPDIEVYPPLQSVDDRSTGGKVTPWVVVLETKNPIVLQRFDMNFRVVTSKSALERTVLVYPDPKTGEATLTGHVIMYDGRIDVVGNRFEMEENARVIFDGDPGDPKLNVTARWDSPDGTRVFADVTGPLRDPRIQFRSEPAMPQAEILALILFGPQTQGSGTTTAGAEGDSSGATDVGGGVASAGINMLLQDLSPGVSTRIDTSRGQSPSPTVVVQVSQNVTAEATYISEEATLDKSDRYLVTFDWRFMRQWSLRITRGNVGTSILDVIWQHRY